MEAGKTAAGILIGIGIGALIGVLFAPEKGSRTRRRIMDKGQDFSDDIKNKFNELCQDATNKYESFLEEVKPIAPLK